MELKDAFTAWHAVKGTFTASHAGMVPFSRCWSPAISGEHPDWDEYREAMVKQGKSIIRVTIESWGPIAKGGFPAQLA